MTRMYRNIGIFAGLTAGVLLADQWLKKWVVATIPLGTTKSAGNPIFTWTYLQNRGAAWSLFQDQLLFFVLISVAVTVALLVILVKNMHKGNALFMTALGLIMGGTWGNFIDRLRLNYVVDMVQLSWIDFPIFNIADSALSVGVACLLIWMLLDERARKN